MWLMMEIGMHWKFNQLFYFSKHQFKVHLIYISYAQIGYGSIIYPMSWKICYIHTAWVMFLVYIQIHHFSYDHKGAMA